MTVAINEPIVCDVSIRPAAEGFSPMSLSQIVGRQSQPAILGGNRSVEGFSIFAAHPVEVFTLDNVSPEPIDSIQNHLRKYRLKSTNSIPNSIPLPGWIGYLSYDLGRHIESFPSAAMTDIDMPMVYLAFYDAMIVYDHAADLGYLVALDFAGQTESLDLKFTRLEQWIEQSRDLILQLPSNVPPPGTVVQPYRTNMTQADYFLSLERIHCHIINGDVYQINFSQRFELAFLGDPAALFLWQNTYNPSPYAAYLATTDWTVVSASPELFLHVRDRHILTRPIKGTRSRIMCECSDEAKQVNSNNRDALFHSEKERAELMMIADLERNDLSRVCVPGTRHVTQQRVIAAYPTVFHAYAEISGLLEKSCDPAVFCDILRATFPGGSITGAPKIRAMEMIEMLEPTHRGVYTGCIGHIGLDFGMVWNIAIRTIIIKSGTAFVQVGGGIVADSDPQAEWDETMTKAKALLDGIGAVTQAGTMS